jgi:predicted component of type VI protein secretion system
MSGALLELTPRSIEALADRVYSLGVSHIVTMTHGDQADLVAASRALRRLLQSYERAAGRPLSTILLAGGA